MISVNLVILRKFTKYVAAMSATIFLSACAADTQTTSENGGFLDGLKKLGDEVSATGGKILTNAAAGVKGAADGNGEVRGYVPLQNGQTLTCFNHLSNGLVSNGGPITNPAQGKAAPIVVTTAKGNIVTGECDKLAQQGDLVPWLPPTTNPGASDGGTTAKATVPVFTYKDAEGNTISNAPDNCRIIHVSDANGRFIKKRYLSRQEDFVLASKCENALEEQISKAARPAGQ